MLIQDTYRALDDTIASLGVYRRLEQKYYGVITNF